MRIVQQVSTSVLGLTEARVAPLKRNPSNAEAKLTRRLRLLKTAWKVINDRLDGKRFRPSDAMRAVWDAGIKPEQPKPDSILHQLSQPAHRPHGPCPGLGSSELV